MELLQLAWEVFKIAWILTTFNAARCYLKEYYERHPRKKEWYEKTTERNEP